MECCSVAPDRKGLVITTGSYAIDSQFMPTIGAVPIKSGPYKRSRWYFVPPRLASRSEIITMLKTRDSSYFKRPVSVYIGIHNMCSICCSDYIVETCPCCGRGLCYYDWANDMCDCIEDSCPTQQVFDQLQTSDSIEVHVFWELRQRNVYAVGYITAPNTIMAQNAAYNTLWYKSQYKTDFVLKSVRDGVVCITATYSVPSDIVERWTQSTKTASMQETDDSDNNFTDCDDHMQDEPEMGQNVSTLVSYGKDYSTALDSRSRETCCYIPCSVATRFMSFMEEDMSSQSSTDTAMVPSTPPRMAVS